MSFTFNWPRFSDQFHYDAIQMLNTALNKGNKPPIIADKIEVVELEMGTQPPELEIRDIGDLTMDQFRGIFRLTYNGDAHLVLKTKVQANPLNHKLPDIHQITGSTGMLAAKQPLVVPMLLRLSQFRLSSIVVLVVSKQKGITIVFKTDPLQNVDINSTFDSIAVIQNFIQREIEGQLRQMFREDLPSIIHRLSQQWVKAKVETPYQKQNQSSLKQQPMSSPSLPLNPNPRHGLPLRQGLETMSTPDLSMPNYTRRRTTASDGLPTYRPSLSTRRPRSTTGISVSNRVTSPSPLSAPPLSNAPSNSTVTPNNHDPEDEPFDPTYGLRPEGIPTKPIFKAFSSLFTQNKGLADLAEESQDGSLDGESDYQDSSGSLTEDEDYEGNSYDFVDWGCTSNTNTPPEPAIEYEAIPAIGGGTVTRPRIIHSQSQIQSPPGGLASALGSGVASTSSRNIAGVFAATRSGATTPGVISRNPSNPYFADIKTPISAPPALHSYPNEPGYAESSTAGSSMGKRPAYPYSVQEEAAIYARSRRPEPAYPHPYDLERHRYDYEEEEYDDDEDEFDEDDDGRHHRHLRSAQQRHEYLSMHTSNQTSTSIASSPPRPGLGRPQTRRRLSVSSNTTTRTSISHSADPSGHGGNPKIVLRPSLLNNSIHHLSTLSQSNHTLSPYTRSLEHFAVRSGPPRALSTIHRSGSGGGVPDTLSPSTSGGSPVQGGSGGGVGLAAGIGGGSGSLGRSKGGAVAGIVGLGASTARFGKTKAEVAVKARRKRTYRIGGKKQANPTQEGEGAGAFAGPDAILRDGAGPEAWSHGPGGHDGGRSEIGVKGKERQRTRRRRRTASAPGTDFDEEDMDRYFKSMQGAAD